MIDDYRHLGTSRGSRKIVKLLLFFCLLTLVDVSPVMRLGSCKSVVNIVFVHTSFISSGEAISGEGLFLHN